DVTRFAIFGALRLQHPAPEKGGHAPLDSVFHRRDQVAFEKIWDRHDRGTIFKAVCAAEFEDALYETRLGEDDHSVPELGQPGKHGEVIVDAAPEARLLRLRFQPTVPADFEKCGDNRNVVAGNRLIVRMRSAGSCDLRNRLKTGRQIHRFDPLSHVPRFPPAGEFGPPGRSFQLFLRRLRPSEQFFRFDLDIENGLETSSDSLPLRFPAAHHSAAVTSASPGSFRSSSSTPSMRAPRLAILSADTIIFSKSGPSCVKWRWKSSTRARSRATSSSISPTSRWITSACSRMRTSLRMAIMVCTASMSMFGETITMRA